MNTNRGPENREVKRIHGAAQRLADWLNSPRSKGHPATKVWVLTQAMVRAARDKRHPLSRSDFKDYQTEINALTKRFRGYIGLERIDLSRPDTAHFDLWPVSQNGRGVDGLGVVNDIRILGRAGVLWKVRRCALWSCKRAFAAKVPHQMFCPGGKCKEKHKRSSPEYKCARRDKARTDYYQSLGDERKKKILEAKRARRAQKRDKQHE
jgi:hypothetical protein